jgi:putative transposase
MIDASVVKLTPTVGSAAACRALNTSRAGVYRRRSPRPVTAKFTTGKGSHRSLSVAERTAVLDTLHSDRFVNDSPAQVYATLLDEGTYLASQSTMYRLLAANGEVRRSEGPPEFVPFLARVPRGTRHVTLQPTPI